MTNLINTALALHKHGISVVPVMVDGTKRPAGTWAHYQKSRATIGEIQTWFNSTAYGLGLVTGEISGNLEMTEIEGRAISHMPALAQLATETGLAQLWEKLNNGWTELSPSGGIHWFYRLKDQPVPGNTKIAKDGKIVLTETRGEGGFVITAPSAGAVHPTGKPWLRLSGGPATMPTLTEAERKAFHTLLATIGTQPEPIPQASLPMPGPRDPDAGITPGDDFEQKTTWAQILEPHGWTAVTTHGTTTYWRRPGKTDIGLSATTGHAQDRDRLYVFSTSTEFESEMPYTKFGAYALLEHGGDHTAAARALRAAGLGSEPHLTIPPGQSVFANGLAAEPIRARLPNARQAAPVATTATAEVIDLAKRRDQAAQRTLDRSDDGNAMRLINEHSTVLRYNPDRGRWLAWDGSRWHWQPKGGGWARELAKQIGRALPENNAAESKHKRVTLSAVGITNMLAQAQTDQRITVSMDELDAHPWELNTPGGIINLKTGELGPPDPAQLHTRITTCTPDPTPPIDRWLGFLDDTFPDNDELIAYMQRLIGYSSVGKVEAHILPFGFGSGGNGKGVLLETIAAVLGDYATSAQSGFLMASQFQGHSTEIARLAGARLVLCSEVDERDRFDEAKVKLLTGGDRLTARFMRQDDFTFKPTHHLWLTGNFQPAVESGGEGFWRRLRLIPFLHTVPEEKRVDDLQGILANEHGPAILHWIAQGAASFAQNGLQEPDQVRAATKAYAADVDTVGRFLEEDCITGAAAAGMSVRVSTLRSAYERWCTENGERAIQGRGFATQLSRHGVIVGRDAPRGSGGVRLYGNLGLPSEQSPSDLFDGDRGGW